MMTEDIDEIRKKRAADKLAALDSDDVEARKEVLEAMPWALAIQKETGTVELRLNDEVIALTQDANWAVMVVELMNRLMLAEQAGIGERWRDMARGVCRCLNKAAWHHRYGICMDCKGRIPEWVR